jgi:2-dehydropantoate 2-reductase
MSTTGRIHILGGGAVGLALAAFLVRSGRDVLLVRTREDTRTEGRTEIQVRTGTEEVLSVPIETTSLAQVNVNDGLAVVTAKCNANRLIAEFLRKKAPNGPAILLQNGLGIEAPFLEAGCPQIYRGVLYLSAQHQSEKEVTFRSVASSPLGIIQGNAAVLAECADALSTPWLRFHAEPAIERAVWKKAIVNAAFNSICPLLETDNGIFMRETAAAELAAEIVGECVELANAKGISLTVMEIMEQIFSISQASEGILISTLQDIRHGRETEIDSLNLELARLAATLRPPIELTRTELLGKLALLKAMARKVSRLENSME